MPTYHLTLAQTVQVYGTVEIEAESAEAAIEKARADADNNNGGAYWQDVTDIAWEGAQEERVVTVEGPGPDGGDVALYEGIDLTPASAPWRVKRAADLRSDLDLLVRNGHAEGDALRPAACPAGLSAGGTP